ncbi:TPA: hypothetical protein ROY17_005843, partial [Bacillus thuringiensis]|nr:hypothetical protein [Bacillus thuringiensis]
TYKNKEEYFAEAFAYYYLDEQSKTELKEKAPYTYAYIEDVLKKINIEPKQFEKELNEMLNLNRSFISFDVKNNTTVLEYEEAQRFINNIGKVDKEILNNLVDKGASLKIINYPLTEIPEYSYLKGKLISTTNEGVELNWDECYGLTPPSIQNPIVVRMGYRDHTSSVNAELHEIGHAVDNFVVPGISVEEGFRKPFEKEQEKFLPNSYYKDPKEYFAECFAYYYLDEQSKQQLKDEAPETYAYVKFLINVIKEALNELDSLK